MITCFSPLQPEVNDSKQNLPRLIIKVDVGPAGVIAHKQKRMQQKKPRACGSSA